MVPSTAEPPVVPLTDHVTALFVVPETLAVNKKESPARMFAVEGDTAAVIDGGGGGGGVELLPRVVAEQPATKSAARLLPSWSNLRISEDTHWEPTKTKLSLEEGKVRGYWPRGQYLADVREMRRSRTAICE